MRRRALDTAVAASLVEMERDGSHELGVVAPRIRELIEPFGIQVDELPETAGVLRAPTDEALAALPLVVEALHLVPLDVAPEKEPLHRVDALDRDVCGGLGLLGDAHLPESFEEGLEELVQKPEGVEERDRNIVGGVHSCLPILNEQTLMTRLRHKCTLVTTLSIYS